MVIDDDMTKWDNKFCTKCSIELTEDNRKYRGVKRSHVCKDCFRKAERERLKIWLSNSENKRKKREYMRHYELLHPEYVKRKREQQKLVHAGRRAYRRMRRMVLDALGNRCVRCGNSDWRVLQIDHVKGGGYADRKKNHSHLGWSTYKKILNEVKNGSPDYQILCANCNSIKRYENGENWRLD